MKRIIAHMLILLFGLSACAAHSSRQAGQETITLSLHSPLARNVQFLSSLDGYQGHETRRTLLGYWEINIPAGKNFRYFYEVDGSPYVPDCRFREFDDFGTQICIYVP